MEENQLLIETIRDIPNAGTWQYWKIFSYCVGQDEVKVSKMGNPNLVSRLRSKIDVLRKMRDNGIWLLDASVVGLYGAGRKDNVVSERVIGICWRGFIRNMILEVNPRNVIVIGKGVAHAIGYGIQELKIPFKTVSQPQARETSYEQQENYETYRKICSKFMRN